MSAILGFVYLIGYLGSLGTLKYLHVNGWYLLLFNSIKESFNRSISLLDSQSNLYLESYYYNIEKNAILEHLKFFKTLMFTIRTVKKLWILSLTLNLQRDAKSVSTKFRRINEIVLISSMKNTQTAHLFFKPSLQCGSVGFQWLLRFSQLL